MGAEVVGFDAVDLAKAARAAAAAAAIADSPEFDVFAVFGARCVFGEVGVFVVTGSVFAEDVPVGDVPAGDVVVEFPTEVSLDLGESGEGEDTEAVEDSGDCEGGSGSTSYVVQAL